VCVWVYIHTHYSYAHIHTCRVVGAAPMPPPIRIFFFVSFASSIRHNVGYKITLARVKLCVTTRRVREPRTICARRFFSRTQNRAARKKRTGNKTLRRCNDTVIVYIYIYIIYNLYNGKPPALGRCSSAKPLSCAKYDVRSDRERVSERERTMGTGDGEREKRRARRPPAAPVPRCTTGWSLRALDFII
jgi:hypothetical protein